MSNKMSHMHLRANTLPDATNIQNMQSNMHNMHNMQSWYKYTFICTPHFADAEMRSSNPAGVFIGKKSKSSLLPPGPAIWPCRQTHYGRPTKTEAGQAGKSITHRSVGPGRAKGRPTERQPPPCLACIWKADHLDIQGWEWISQDIPGNPRIPILIPRYPGISQDIPGYMDSVTPKIFIPEGNILMFETIHFVNLVCTSIYQYIMGCPGTSFE